MEATPKPVYDVASVVEPIGSHYEGEAGSAMIPPNVMMAVLYLVVCVVGLAGNCLVIAALLKLDRLRTATTVYVFNLALADGLFMVGLPFIAFQNLQDHWPFGDLACRLVVVLDGVNQFTSVFCLTVMSVDRCLAAADPLRFGSWRLPGRAKAVSLLLWPLSLLLVLPMAAHFSAESGQCVLDAHESLDSWWLIFISCTFVLGFVVPFIIIMASYTVLALALRARRLGWAQSPGSQQPENQVTRMVAAVALAFAICWLPFYAVNFYSLHHHDQEAGIAVAFKFAVLLSYSWSCTNPILYACFSETFRRHFSTLLCPATQTLSRDANTEALDLHDSSAAENSAV